jgi:hypothetical protein
MKRNAKHGVTQRAHSTANTTQYKGPNTSKHKVHHSKHHHNIQPKLTIDDATVLRASCGICADAWAIMASMAWIFIVAPVSAQGLGGSRQIRRG